MGKISDSSGETISTVWLNLPIRWLYDLFPMALGGRWSELMLDGGIWAICDLDIESNGRTKAT